VRERERREKGERQIERERDSETDSDREREREGGREGKELGVSGLRDPRCTRASAQGYTVYGTGPMA